MERFYEESDTAIYNRSLIKEKLASLINGDRAYTPRVSTLCCDLSFCSDIFFSVMSHVCVWMEVILYHEDDTSGLSGGLYPDGVRFMDKW